MTRFFSKVVLGEFIHYTNILISMRSSTQQENFSSATFIHVSKNQLDGTMPTQMGFQTQMLFSYMYCRSFQNF